jgi:pseudaminic acid biosynthesis-associated methylase
MGQNMKFNSNQEQFWAKTYAEDYIKKNNQFDHKLGAEGWSKILNGTNNEVKSFLECGCNIGRNIEQIGIVNPNAKPSIIEISKPAFDYVTSKYKFENAFNGPILDAKFNVKFDLVFSMGVLIHINPDQLVDHMKKMHELSSKYIVMGEYFNRTPTSVPYQGQPDKLFKRDFGKLFMENFDVKLVDYGFLWGHIYDNAGFDDITWWLFKK